jgi:hypothetical protein
MEVDGRWTEPNICGMRDDTGKHSKRDLEAYHPYGEGEGAIQYRDVLSCSDKPLYYQKGFCLLQPKGIGDVLI